MSPGASSPISTTESVETLIIREAFSRAGPSFTSFRNTLSLYADWRSRSHLYCHVYNILLHLLY
jgi:hypothetical protein